MRDEWHCLMHQNTRLSFFVVSAGTTVSFCARPKAGAAVSLEVVSAGTTVSLRAIPCAAVSLATVSFTIVSADEAEAKKLLFPANAPLTDAKPKARTAMTENFFMMSYY